MSQTPVVPVQTALASLLTPSLVHNKVLLQSNLFLKIRHFPQHSGLQGNCRIHMYVNCRPLKNRGDKALSEGREAILSKQTNYTN